MDTGESYIKDLEAGLDAILDKFDSDLKVVRTSRPSVELVENIKVDYYGERLPIKQLCSLSVKSPRELNFNVWDKSAVNSVVKAIEEAKMGFSVLSEGNLVRAFLPPLSQERREEFTKLAKRMAESSRIQIREKRDDVLKRIKAAQENKEISEDQFFKLKEKAQEVVDKSNKKIEEKLEEKLKELSD